MIATDWVILNGPYPPESSATRSPRTSVAAIAAPNDRQGCVNEHGLLSTPCWAETNVRGAALRVSGSNAMSPAKTSLFMSTPWRGQVGNSVHQPRDDRRDSAKAPDPGLTKNIHDLGHVSRLNADIETRVDQVVVRPQAAALRPLKQRRVLI